MRQSFGRGEGNRKRLFIAAGFALMALPLLSRTATGGDGVDWLGLQPQDFVIVSPDTKTAIGRGHYNGDRFPGGITLHGENRFTDGQYDLEDETIIAPAPGTWRLTQYSHSFFNADGSPQRVARADLTSGYAVCQDFTSGTERDRAERLTIPSGTIAGGSISISVQLLYRAGDLDARDLHIFACAPGPKVIDLDLKTPTADVWQLYGKPTMRVDATPDFGVLSLLVAPFAPKVDFWFDSQNRWNLVGAELPRYYRGPEILMVKSKPMADPAAANKP
ncbi:MAG TPA: hypothetical protein VMU16_00640 [Candidatus Binataceae bacterium]|nr:hypothetical protein [Candidatus Binataceae bacterium]